MHASTVRAKLYPEENGTPKVTTYFVLYCATGSQRGNKPAEEAWTVYLQTSKATANLPAPAAAPDTATATERCVDVDTACSNQSQLQITHHHDHHLAMQTKYEKNVEQHKIRQGTHQAKNSYTVMR